MPEPPPSHLPEPPAVSEQIPGTGIDATDATVAALRAALAAGAVTARGLTAFYLSRIERLDPVLHSVISVSGDALAEAQAIDDAWPAGRRRARSRASRS
jgi:amidase